MIHRLKIARSQQEVERLLKECGELVFIFVKSIFNTLLKSMVANNPIRFYSNN